MFIIDQVQKINDLKGVETKHPLVTAYDYKDAPLDFYPEGDYRYEIYTIYFKEMNCGELKYGRTTYDYEEGTLMFIGPGQIIGVPSHDGIEELPKGRCIAFHPDFLIGTGLADKFGEYSFFSYEMNEALHLSLRERKIILDIFDKLAYELDQNIDTHTKRIIVSELETLLNYSLRFYDRQFITREKSNQGILDRFMHQLDEFFNSDESRLNGLPSVSRFAEEMNLSPNYFGDLVKRETNKTPKELIHLRLIRKAKDLIMDKSKTISEVAYELGFQYPQHFSRLFKNVTGMTPNEFRRVG